MKAEFFGFGGRSAAGRCDGGGAYRGILLKQASLVQAILTRGMRWASSGGRWVLQRDITGGQAHSTGALGEEISSGKHQTAEYKMSCERPQSSLKLPEEILGVGAKENTAVFL